MDNKLKRINNTMKKFIPAIITTIFFALFLSGCQIELDDETFEISSVEDSQVYEDTTENTEIDSNLVEESETIDISNEDNSDETNNKDDNVAEENTLEEDEDAKSTEVDNENDEEKITYTFRNSKLLEQHYEKHGIEMGFDSASAYEAAASDVINNPDALTKTEAEDGDFVYYVEDTNEFVVLSTDGYIRTYFYPSAGKAYYDRQ